MSRKLDFLRSLLRMLFQFVFVLILMHVYFVSYVNLPFAPEWIGTILFYFLVGYAFDFFCKNIILKILLHIGMIVSAIALPYIIEIKLFMLAVVLGVTVTTVCRSTFVKKKEENNKTQIPVAYILFIVILNMYSYYQGNSALIRTCNLLPIIMLFIFLLQVYLDGLKNYINLTNAFSGVPIKRIIVTNSTFVGGIICALLVMVIALNVFGVDGSSMPIWRGLGAAALLLFFGVIYLYGSFVNKFTDSTKDGFVYGKAEDLFKDEGSNKLGEVLEMLLFVGIIIGVIYVLYKMITLFAKLFLMQKQNFEDSIERADALTDVAEKRSVSDKKYKSQSSAEEKVRRLYKNHIMKRRHFLYPSEYKTARDYEKETQEQELGDISAMTNLYTSVRYGNGTVDKETVKEMKELLKATKKT